MNHAITIGDVVGLLFVGLVASISFVVCWAILVGRMLSGKEFWIEKVFKKFQAWNDHVDDYKITK